MLSALGYVGILLMVVSGVLFLLGHKEKARQAKKAARVVSTTRRAIRTFRVVMAFTSGLGGFGMTGYDLATPGCDDDESLRSPTSVVQLVSYDTLAEGEEDDEGDNDDDEGCDD